MFCNVTGSGRLSWVILLTPGLLGYHASVFAGSCPLNGRWQSNEARTLASLHATGKVNKRQRALFENHYFGHLSMTYTCKEITVRYAGDSDILDYQIVRRDGPHITIRTTDDETDEGRLRELLLTPDGKCYSVPVAKFQFREYFCRE